VVPDDQGPRAKTDTLPRCATVDDVAELVRLRALMLGAVGADMSADDGWRDRCAQRLHELLTSESFVAFVIDAPDGGLAACGAGWVDRRLPAPGTDGLAGFLGNMSTDPAHRRRGHARAIVSALMEWFRAAGVSRVDLHATEHAQSLYEREGFNPPAWPALRWHAPRQ
jgi:GNAT superfamily N-acetyltransferase